MATTASIAAALPPVRFVPTWEQIKKYLLRPRDTTFVTSRSSRQARFFKQYNQYNPGRRVFCTKSGRIGNGHQSARPGDQIWYLAHCTVPFILRPVRDDGTSHGIWEETAQQEATCGHDDDWEDVDESEGRFRMIGACYVHGLMHREGGFDELATVPRRIVIE